MPLAALRPDPRAEADLRWFFTAAEGEMGLRSNWQMYVNEIVYLTRRRSTFSVDPTTIDIDLRGAERELPIRRALEQLTPQVRGELNACFNDLHEVAKEWPGIGPNETAELAVAFRELTGLVPFVAAAEHCRSRTTRPVLEWLVRVVRKAKKKDVAAQRIVAALLRDAEGRMLDALNAYRLARREIRRHR